MLGDALLVSKGVGSIDHIEQINELFKLNVNTKRPIKILDNLRRLRHNINYYGYKPNMMELEDTIDIAKSCFEPIYKKVYEEISPKQL
ncbi:MAG: hypothetical protein WC755_01405 [Candidatus Woesearchaeota archaeon]|jgi:hypothetical protein